jgi:acetyl-CoA carboxylase biotin carboxyl carrier protein
MDLNYVKKLVKLLSESDLDEIEIEEEGNKIRLAKRPNTVVAHPLPPTGPYPQGGMQIPYPGVSAENPPSPQMPAVAASPGAPVPSSTPEASPANQQHEIKSPIVGTFYRAPAPEAAPFIQVGSEVEPGTVLCIVEAMKLMNEIESDISGKIVKILAENGQPIEYDQTLFLVEKV